MENHIIITLNNFYHIISDFYFDRKLGLRTQGQKELHRFTFDNYLKKHGKRYQPSRYLVVKKVLKSVMAILPHHQYTFCDLGCGLGRVLHVAAPFFPRLLGIEFVPELCHQAKEFVRQKKLQDKIEIEQNDVLSFDIPTGPIIFFMYNPFDSFVLKSFLEKIENLNPNEDYWLVYLNPMRKHLIELNSHFDFRLAVKHFNHNNQALIYQRRFLRLR
jgi:SAM-dependent methyltransferase